MTAEQLQGLKAIKNNGFIPFFLRKKAELIMKQDEEIGVAESYVEEYLNGVGNYLSRRRNRRKR